MGRALLEQLVEDRIVRPKRSALRGLLQRFEADTERRRRRLERSLMTPKTLDLIARLPAPRNAVRDRGASSDLPTIHRRLDRSRRRAEKNPTTRNLHRFRKRLREFTLFFPRFGRPRKRETGPSSWAPHPVLRRLGRLHDLSVLRSWVEAQEGTRPSDPILRDLERYQRRLTKQALRRAFSGT